MAYWLIASKRRADHHLDEVTSLAEQLQLPVAPTATPPVGEGGPFHTYPGIRALAGVEALALIVALVGARLLVIRPTTVAASTR